MDRSALAWAQLQVLTRKRYEQLRQRFGSLQEAWGQVSGDLLRELGCTAETVQAKATLARSLDLEGLERRIGSSGIQVVCFDDPPFPSRLREIPDPPVFLFARGDLALLQQPCIALVGTRSMSVYGKRVVCHLVPPLVRSGVVTVSGLAHGVDSEIAKVTLQEGGKTVAVLGHGFARMTSRSSGLAKEILESGGLLITEYPLDCPPSEYTFPQRNRIISGVSLGTVIVEADEGSGSLITASLALEQGRDVWVVPGSLFDQHYRGCHALIARGGGKLVTSGEEILEDVGIAGSGSGSDKVFTLRTKEEEIVYGALTTMPQALDDVVEVVKLPTSKVSSTLTVLELRGAVKNLGAGQWVRA